MYMNEPDANDQNAHADDRRVSVISSPLSASLSASDRRSYATAVESVQQSNSGLGSNSAGNNDNAIRSMSSSQPARPLTAIGSRYSKWFGGGLPSADTRVEPSNVGGEPNRRRRTAYHLPSLKGKSQQPVSKDNGEAWDQFLRTVTPPPTNYMSVPSPSIGSSRSSPRRRNSRKKKGPLTRCLLFLKGGSRRKKPARKPSVRASSPPILVRTASRKQKRPPPIKLPETAVSGKTVDGHRHIAISIPIEHDHLGPWPKYRSLTASRRTKSLPSAELSPTNHSNANGRPVTAFTNEPPTGSQLGPVAEERGSMSSKSWERERDSQRVQEEAYKVEQEEAYKVGLASRHTFGPAPGHVSSPDTGSMSPPIVPRRSSHRYSSPSAARPKTPATGDELREIARAQALAALSRPRTAPRPASGQSAHSFRSFTTESPAPRVYHPTRKSSMRPGSVDDVRPRAERNSDQRGLRRQSRDSARELYVLRQSLVSEHSFLESIGAVDSESDGTVGAVEPRELICASKGVHDGTPRELTYASEVADDDTASESSFEWQGGKATEGGKNSSRGSKRSSFQGSSSQEIRRSGGQDSDTLPIWTRREMAAPVLVNLEVRRAEAQTTRRSQLRESVEVILETPTEPSSPGEKGDGSEDGYDGLKDISESPSKEAESEGKEKGQDPGGVPMLKVPGENNSLKGKGKERPSSPLLSPEKRGEQRKEMLLLRRQKIAELRKALENPGMEPKDLVWRRRPSNSSQESSDENHRVDEGSRGDKRATVVQVPAALENDTHSPKVTPARFSLSAVMTVADVKPSSPQAASPKLGITRKTSLTISASSPAIAATVVKSSSIPPYRSLESVTPPDSPPPSATSSSPVSSVEAQTQGTPLHHPPLQRPNSSRRLLSTSGLQSPASTSGRFPATQVDPSRPTTATKASVPSTFHSQPQSPRKQHAEASTSMVKVPQSELFGLYEALREEQTRDMEIRLKRLERNRDDWMDSMLPLLTGMSQALDKLAITNKGKEIARSPQVDIRQPRRPKTSHSDDKRNRTWRSGSSSQDAEPSTRASVKDGQGGIDGEEATRRRHTHVATSRSRAGTSTSESSRRRHPPDEALQPPRSGHHIHDNIADDEHEYRTRSVSLGETSSRRHRRRERTTSIPLPPEAAASLQSARDAFGMTSMVEGSGVRANPKVADPASHLRDEVEAEEEAEVELLKRLERLDGRIDSRKRSLSLGAVSALGVGGPMGFESRRETVSDGTYAGAADDGYEGMGKLEGLMKELQSSVKRLSTIVGSGDADREGEVSETPRSVVGFGAFM
ncbi:hypothetical protein VM1G_08978 [Cytospora mali]|uniref:Uncharacterized protein n=1 Tax=Cytospora mali TaxID=578113 RepID=A0A194WAE7_CYTMA|nr:hypothetical protein VM1G_08978 [Valsa mali]